MRSAARIPPGPRHLLAGALTCAAAVAAPVAANESANPRLTFGFDQRIETLGNAGLDIPSLGDTTQAVTRLSFGLTSETLSDSLSFTGGASFRLGDVPEGRIARFDDPRLDLSYRREGADSQFTIRGSFRRSRLDFLRSLLDFVDEDGELDLPEDFEDLTGRGQRTAYDLEAQLALGQSDAPFGVTLTLGAGGIDYSSAANRDDVRTIRGGIDTRYRLSPVMTATLGYSRSERREGSAPVERRDTDRVTSGLTYALSPRTDLRATLGYSRIDRSGTVSTREEGIEGSVDVDVETLDGTYGFGIDVRRIEAGVLASARLRRGLELRSGGLSGTLGATRLPGGTAALTGGLGWNYDTRDGGLTVNLARSVGGDEDDPRIRTTLSAGYTYDINSVSGFSLRADHARSSGTALTNRVEQSSLRATYTHQLTADWALNSGVGYRERTEQGVGRARSPELFLGIGRQYEWPL